MKFAWFFDHAGRDKLELITLFSEWEKESGLARQKVGRIGENEKELSKVGAEREFIPASLIKNANFFMKPVPHSLSVTSHSFSAHSPSLFL